MKRKKRYNVINGEIHWIGKDKKGGNNKKINKETIMMKEMRNVRKGYYWQYFILEKNQKNDQTIRKKQRQKNKQKKKPCNLNRYR